MNYCFLQIAPNPCPRNVCIRIWSAYDTFHTVTALAKCSLLTNISKIMSSSTTLIDATVISLLFSRYAVFVLLTKTLQSIMQAYNLHVTKRGVGSTEMA